MIKMFGIKKLKKKTQELNDSIKKLEEVNNNIKKLEEKLKNEKSFIKKLYKNYDLYKEKYIKEPKFLVMNTDYYLLLRKDPFFYNISKYHLGIEYILCMEIVIDDNIVGWYVK